MSAEINEIENRGRESQQSNRRLGSRTTENGCEGRLGVAKGPRMRRGNRNSQNEPGMSAEINEIENRGGY